MSEKTTDTVPVPTAKKAEHLGERTTQGALTRLEPKSFQELEHIAQVLGKSDIVPKEMIGKPANILLALMFGNEIGLTPAQALQNIMVVNGRPSLWGDAMMGLVLSSDVYEDSKDSYDPKTKTATFAAKRRGKDWVVRSFSMADAAAAKLDKKAGPWQEYPQRMLFHRARAWALRDTFADVLKGLRYFEEERDVINLSKGPDKVYAMPPGFEKPSPALAGAAAGAVASAPQAAEVVPPQPDGIPFAANVYSAATTDFQGDPDWFVIKDTSEPPVKYFTNDERYYKIAKQAQEKNVRIAGIYVEKKSDKGAVRIILAIQLKAEA